MSGISKHIHERLIASIAAIRATQSPIEKPYKFRGFYSKKGYILGKQTRHGTLLCNVMPDKVPNQKQRRKLQRQTGIIR